MSLLTILRYPDPRLNKVAKPVAAVDARIRTLIDDPSQAWDGIQAGKRLIFALLDCIKPVIAKINGTDFQEAAE